MKKKTEFHFPFIEHMRLNFQGGLTMVTALLMISEQELTPDASRDFQQVTEPFFGTLVVPF